MIGKKSVFAAFFVVALTVGCFNFFSPSCVGDQCNASASKVDAPVATPTPSPTPFSVDSSCEQSCKVFAVTIDNPKDTIALGETAEFNMSPYTEVDVCDASGKPTGKKTYVKTTSECDDPRAGAVAWSASNGALQVSGVGFKANVKRVATGPSTLTVSLEGKSYSRIIH